MVGCCGCQHDQVKVGGVHSGMFERLPSRRDRKIGCLLIISSNMTCLNTRSLYDPFVSGINALDQFLVRDNPLGQICATSRDNGSPHHQEAATSRVADLFHPAHADLR